MLPTSPEPDRAVPSQPPSVSPSPPTRTLLACCAALTLALAPAEAATRAPSWSRLLAFDAATQTAWGERYEHGEGVTRSYDRAVQLYCAAARRGFVRAQYRLGWMYANGRGVARNDALAAAWFKLAAAKGDEQSRQMLRHLPEPRAGTQARCVGPKVENLAPIRVSISSPERRAVAAAVRQLAQHYELDPALVLAVIDAESGFDHRAVSPKGAMGLMQLMPGTAERFGVRDPFDPEQNLKGGMAYLRWLIAYFEGRVPLVVAAYNAGEQAVERYGGIPPYPETQTYVQRVTRAYPHLRHPVASGAKVAGRTAIPVPGEDS